ncbi:MAG: bifunctional phosphoribosylaminoimidazolecarboxamide formyltransferase/IMP cyclohydrolase [Bradymonadia bacterium]
MTARRALLSLYDKTDIETLGAGLHALGFELIASGGTAKALAAAGFDVISVDDLTGFPPMLGGRVKTLHPAVHGGLLARRTPEHLGELERYGLAPIDLVVCNLYPFTDTIAREGVTEAEAIEQIDIGGVTLLRAAAKNLESVTVLCDPADYDAALSTLRLEANDDRSVAFRRKMALKAFRHTAAYDAAISTWMASTVAEDTTERLPPVINVALEQVQTLRYGENPHQHGAVYRPAGSTPYFEMVQGEKALSYNNALDLAATWPIPFGFEGPAVAIVKHNSPCGVATGPDTVSAFKGALASDPVSAFGSIVAVNRPVDESFIEAVGKLFVEVIAAPSFTEGALAMLARKKKNCRVMRPLEGRRPSPLDGFDLRAIPGGMLVQEADHRPSDRAAWKVVTERAPEASEYATLAFAWQSVRHVKSNAILIARPLGGGVMASVGIGGGQTNRVDAVRHAAERAGEQAQGAALASDAFFPFPDGVEAAAAAGVTSIIQPGGSIRDEAVIEAANRLGLAMVFTGARHFRH